MTKKIWGWLFVTASAILFLIDRFSSIVSTFVAEKACGNDFMQPVEAVIGDVSCGFNADMYLALILVVVLLIGVGLLFLDYRKSAPVVDKLRNCDSNGELGNEKNDC